MKPNPSLRAAKRFVAPLLCWLSFALGAPAAAESPIAPPAAPVPNLALEELLAFVAAHRDDLAVASYSADAAGFPDSGAPILLHNDTVKMPLASTIKIVILAAFERSVASGRLDRAAEVAVGDWDRFYLPGTDGGAHVRSLAELGIPSDDLGFARDPATRVTLDAIARAMIRQSDNAGADLLADRLGSGALRATLREAGLTGEEEPISLLGLKLALHNWQDGPLSWARVQEIRAMPRRRLAAFARDYADRYRRPAWRDAQIAWLLATPAPSFRLQAAGLQAIWPRGTAADYASLLGRLAAGSFLSPAISAAMLEKLAIPLADQEVFTFLAEKGGSEPGLLTEAVLAVPRVGPYTGAPRVSVVFVRRLGEADWQAALDEAAPFQLAGLLALDPAVVEVVRRALGQ